MVVNMWFFTIWRKLLWNSNLYKISAQPSPTKFISPNSECWSHPALSPWTFLHPKSSFKHSSSPLVLNTTCLYTHHFQILTQAFLLSYSFKHNMAKTGLLIPVTSPAPSLSFLSVKWHQDLLNCPNQKPRVTLDSFHSFILQHPIQPFLLTWTSKCVI